MFLNTQEVLRAVAEEGLIDLTTEEWLENDLEGGKYDLHLHRVYQPDNKHGMNALAETSRTLHEITELQPEGTIKVVEDFWTLEQFQHRVVETAEWINMPRSFTGVLSAKTTLNQAGVLTLFASVGAGYQGYLKLSMINLSPIPFRIYRYAPICGIQFARLTGKDSRPYNGPHEGGKPLSGEYKTGRRGGPYANTR